jgi:hypothetical protein
MICSFVLLKKSSCVVDGNLPRKAVSLVPPPSRLPSGHAAAPRTASSMSLAVQRSGTLVS